MAKTFSKLSNLPVRLLGLKATVLCAGPTVYDRWKWLKRHLQPGPLRTLDAGSGLGAFTMFAAKIGNESTGISLDAGNNQKARERAKMLRVKVEADLDVMRREAEQLLWRQM